MTGTSGDSLATKPESDFSMRKIRISLVVMVGQLFGSSILPMMGFGLILVPMTAEFGWSRTAFSGGITALMWVGGISQPFIGRYIDRAGVRATIIGGTVAVGLLVIAMGFQNGSLLIFYAMWGMLGLIGTTAMGYSKVIGALFSEHRGKALAIFGAESSIAGAAAPLIAIALINHYGWRGMFVGMGLIILAVAPLAWFFLEEPEPAHAAPGRVLAPESLPGLTTREVLRTGSFWLITAAGFLALAPASGMMPHYLPYLLSKGFDQNQGAVMISSMTIAMAVGTLVGGWVLDYAKTARIAAPFSILSALSMVGLLVASPAVGGALLLGASFALMGFNFGAKRPMATYFHTRFFGLRSFGEVTGIQGAMSTFGMGLAPIAIGYSYDRLGSYQPAMLVMIAGLTLSVILYGMLPRYRYSKTFANAPFTEDGTAGVAGEAPIVAQPISA